MFSFSIFPPSIEIAGVNISCPPNGKWFGAVGSDLGQINEVTLRLARVNSAWPSLRV